METADDAVYVYAVIVIVIFMIVSGIYRRYRRKNRTIKLRNTPVLLAYYTTESALIPIIHGDFADYSYSVYRSMSSVNTDTNSVIVEVRLPFKTKLHLLGVTTRNDMTQIRTDIGNSVMEKVTLEGLYDKHFTLFTDKGSQVQARYVLDPKAMEFTIDFCKSHSWEIVRSEFYFVQELVGNVEGDDTHMFKDVERFIEEIRPAVELPLSEKDLKRRAPYGSTHKHRTEIVCPVCSKPLEMTGLNIYECTDHHGMLLHGSDLLKLRRGEVERKYTDSELRNTNEDIPCPSCGQQMTKVDYASSKTIIDTCSNCQYRWVDTGEIAPRDPDVEVSAKLSNRPKAPKSKSGLL